MAQPIPPRTGDEPYRPISGLALGGLLLGGGFAGLVALSGVVAVAKGAPIFYPMWLLIVPVAGFVLSLLGRNQIVGPDAVRAGLGVAHWGMGLSLFSGLGYAAYVFAVSLAVAHQADEFLTGEPTPDRGFLTHLRKAATSPIDLDIAFLLTRPAPARIQPRGPDDDLLVSTYDRPGPDGVGELTQFRRSPIARTLVHAGAEARIEPLGVRQWDHERSSYKVVRAYRIHTPEAVLDAVLRAESTEPEAEGEMRQWFVNLTRSTVVVRERTPLGKRVASLDDSARKFLERDWRPRLAEAKLIPNFDAFDASDWRRIAADDPALAKHADHYAKAARRLFEGKSNDVFVLSETADSWPIWTRDADGRIWFDIPIRFQLPAAGDAPPAVADGILQVRTIAPLDPTAPPANAPAWTAEKLIVQRLRVSRE